MPYEIECWTAKKREAKVHATEVNMVRRMCGVSKKNKIRNDLQLTPLKDKIKEKSRMLFEIVWACTTKGKKKKHPLDTLKVTCSRN